MTGEARESTRQGATIRNIALSLTAIVLISTQQAPAALAHSRLVKSAPAAGETRADSPTRVTAWFSHELETRKSQIGITGVQGRLAEGGVDLFDPDHASMVVRFRTPLPPGRYTVRWRAVSADDGDATEGRFEFVITRGGAP